MKIDSFLAHTRLPQVLLSAALLVLISFHAHAEDRGLAVVAKAVAGQDIQIGRQYAVLIGIDTYHEWNPLRNPVKDAKTIKEILQRRYFIDEFIELYNEDATSTGIRRVFSSLIDKVKPSDSVLIYYAGHGYLDKFNTGFWIPVDGGKDIDDQVHWIPNAQIRNFVTQIKAKSVALISDSCFSGDLLNVSRGAEPTIDSAYFKNAIKYNARQVLTSGSAETVPDESEFARQFKMVLESNTEVCLDPLAIYDRIRRGVTQTMPLFGTLPGHENGGSFILFLRDSNQAQKPPEKAVTSTLAMEIQKEQDHLAILNTELGRAKVNQKTNKTVAAASFITSGITGIASGVLYFLGNSAMQAYTNASTPADAQAKHSTLELYNTLFITSLSVTGAGLGVGGFFLATAPNPARINDQVQSGIEKLKKLEAQRLVEEAKE